MIMVANRLDLLPLVEEQIQQGAPDCCNAAMHQLTPTLLRIHVIPHIKVRYTKLHELPTTLDIPTRSRLTARHDRIRTERSDSPRVSLLCPPG